MKSLIMFIAITITLFFLNMKFSQAIRIMAYGEIEPKNEAVASFVLMIVVSILWTIYFSLF
jgi:hypothetical protein